MTLVLEHPEARVAIKELGFGRRLVEILPPHRGLLVSSSRWETSYPESLIRDMLRILGPAWLCDEIRREEDPGYVRRILEADLQAYIGLPELDGKRILDFGSGCGASTAILARMFPRATIVGVELNPDLLSIARQRIEFFGFQNVNLRSSPRGTELPDGLGQFDVVVMSAVYEHLLAEERKTIMPKLWGLIVNGGYLCLDQTPHRFFPAELHTTMLPLINYLPPPLALQAARRFSPRIGKEETWDVLLRKGIRGGTIREIQRLLRGERDRPILLEPCYLGLRDRIDLWFLSTNREKRRVAKSIVKSLMKVFKLLSGICLVPCLSVALRKPANTSQPEQRHVSRCDAGLVS